jgi:Ca2+-dependent lipid-binding protein
LTEIRVAESGVIIFNVLSGQLSRKARLEVLLDDGYWPAFSTAKARSTNARWEHIGEGFVKELDFGRVWLRLNEADEGYKDNVIAEWKGDAKAFLQGTLVSDSLNRRLVYLLMTSSGWNKEVYFDRRRRTFCAFHGRDCSSLCSCSCQTGAP